MTQELGKLFVLHDSRLFRTSLSEVSVQRNIHDWGCIFLYLISDIAYNNNLHSLALSHTHTPNHTTPLPFVPCMQEKTIKVGVTVVCRTTLLHLHSFMIPFTVYTLAIIHQLVRKCFLS